MKSIIPVSVASLLSAFLAVFIYQHIHTPDQIVIRETLPVAYKSEHLAEMLPAEEMTVRSVPRDFVMAANSSRRAVVSIQSRSTSSNFWRNDSYSSSSGSGIIITPDGYIATNKHVIDEGSEITVVLHDQREFAGVVVSRDATTDLALIKIDAEDLPVITFGNSDSLYVGDWVLAIGNPFRLQSTVTAGIVSAKSRNISILPDQTGIEAFIQTDAAVNPGNSGGALVNTAGELVGINTAIITYSGQYEGFSFAVPSNLAKKILFDLRDYGQVQRGWLGVQIRSVDNEIAKSLGLQTVEGVFVDAVNSDGAAGAAGLQSRDVIIAVNGNAVSGSPDFMEQVGRMRPGDKATIEYIRRGKTRTAEVTLSSNPNSTEANMDDPARRDGLAFDPLLDELGLSVRNLSEDEIARMDREGVFVDQVRSGSRIDRINLKASYIITTVNGQQVENVEEFLTAIHDASEMVILDGFYEKLDEKYPYAFRKE